MVDYCMETEITANVQCNTEIQDMNEEEYCNVSRVGKNTVRNAML